MNEELIQKARRYAANSDFPTTDREDNQLYDWFVGELGAAKVNEYVYRRSEIYSSTYKKLFQLYDAKQRKGKEKEPVQEEPSQELINRAKDYAKGYNVGTTLSDDKILRAWFKSQLGANWPQRVSGNTALGREDYRLLFSALAAQTTSKGRPEESPANEMTNKALQRLRHFAFVGGETPSRMDVQAAGEYFEREIINKTPNQANWINSLKTGRNVWREQYQELFRAVKNQPSRAALERLDTLAAHYISENYNPFRKTYQEFALLLVSVVSVDQLTKNDAGTQQYRLLIAKAIADAATLTVDDVRTLVRGYWHYIKPDFAALAERGAELDRKQKALDQERQALLADVQAYEKKQRG